MKHIYKPYSIVILKDNILEHKLAGKKVIVVGSSYNSIFVTTAGYKIKVWNNDEMTTWLITENMIERLDES